MRCIGVGDMVYTFLGEQLLYVKITYYDINRDPLRLEAEDDDNNYCLYAGDCYLLKEEAIRGMLDSIRELTDCDCGEDEAEIEKYYGGFRCS
jgi:hypothetical protein